MCLLPIEGLSSTERVYRLLAQTLRTILQTHFLSPNITEMQYSGDKPLNDATQRANQKNSWYKYSRILHKPRIVDSPYSAPDFG